MRVIYDMGGLRFVVGTGRDLSEAPAPVLTDGIRLTRESSNSGEATRELDTDSQEF